MKALVRNEKEIILEISGVVGIDWKTGAPLTNKAWCGGPYTLVENYVPPQGDTPEVVVEENEDDYVIIDGKRYSKEELRALL